jgi:hypothetical protein
VKWDAEFVEWNEGRQPREAGKKANIGRGKEQN